MELYKWTYLLFSVFLLAISAFVWSYLVLLCLFLYHSCIFFLPPFPRCSTGDMTRMFPFSIFWQPMAPDLLRFLSVASSHVQRNAPSGNADEVLLWGKLLALSLKTARRIDVGQVFPCAVSFHVLLRQIRVTSLRLDSGRGLC